MSLPFTASEALRWTGGSLLRGREDRSFRGVSTDTRTLEPGLLFVAIRGPKHDAHLFVGQAIAAGASGLLIERNDALPADAPEELVVIVVGDGTRALGALAAGHRSGFDGPVVAITGSNGKTTTKEMCASILAVAGPCLRNRGNLNNAYGLPLTLLERDQEHRSVVVEMGMNHRGEIAALARIAQPTVGVITNVGTAHIEFLGSLEEIAQEKGDLAAALPSTGVAVLNADDARVLGQACRTKARVLRFGLSEAAEIRAEGVTALGDRGHAFDLVTPDDRISVQVAGLGLPTVANALAAAAGAIAAGADCEQVAEGLARYQPIGGRMERVALPRNIIVINDTYNANPQSMEVALRSLAGLKGASRALAVLGDMGELGEAAARAHRATGSLVAELGLDLLFALGDHARQMVDGAIEAGMSADRVHVCKSLEDTSGSLERVLQGNDWVLVKGSRSMQMERVVEAITRGAGDA